MMMLIKNLSSQPNRYKQIQRQISAKSNTKTKQFNSQSTAYNEVSEINNSPSHPRGTPRDGEHNEPSEEEDEYISRPHPWVHEPLRVPVHIRRWSRFHVQIRHRSDLFHNNDDSILPLFTRWNRKPRFTQNSRLSFWGWGGRRRKGSLQICGLVWFNLVCPSEETTAFSHLLWNHF